MRVCPRCAAVYREDVAFCGVDGAELIEQVDDPLVGQTLDHFEVGERIGSGGMGHVYRAVDTDRGTVHAIKVMAGELAANRTIAKRFETEAQSLALIHHPNIVSVSAFGVTPAGLRYIVMELIEGIDLKTALDRTRPFPTARAASITRQLASGLFAAHQADLVHRDLKPSNVMLTSDAGFEYVKLLDFGVVLAVDGPHDTRLTATGLLMGTPGYMAPEQAIDSDVTAKADLYALGAILYEMLAGAPIFPDTNPMQQLVRHATEEPPPLDDHGGLEALAMQLLEKDPANRPHNAAEVVLEIDRLSSRSLRASRKRVRSIGQRHANDAYEPTHPSADVVFSELEKELTQPAPIELSPAMRKPVGRRLGDLLLEGGMVATTDIDDAIAQQAKTGQRLGRILVERGAIAEPRLLQVLSRQLAIDIWRPSAPRIHTRVLATLPLEVARSHLVLPVALKRDETTEFVYLAALDPTDTSMVVAVTERLPDNLTPVWLLARSAELHEALANNYPVAARASKG